MKIQKEYRKLEDIEEVNIYAVHEREFFNYVPQEFEVEKVPFEKLMENIASDINIFIPYNNGEDFIIHQLGKSALKRGNITQKDVEGRLLSKVSPVYNQLLYEALFEVYKTQKTKYMRFLYHDKDTLTRLSNIKIIDDNKRVFIISDHIDINDGKLYIPDDESREENKVNLMEYFSQTGSFYKIKGKYYWTQGIYNIINRSREERDEYYNIVFDLVIPEDRPLVEKIIEIMDSGTPTYESVIRIKTDEKTLKYIEINLYSKFDDKGNFESRYGLMKDVSSYSNKQIARPVDYLLKGFKNSKKLALLIEPLNKKQYEFSQGFYYLIETTPEKYLHSRAIVKNIEETSTIENIVKLLNGKIDEINETFTYNVNGDKNNQKICDMHIERFEVGSETHSIGFITDITEERQKQQALIEANEHQKVLIKEVHHRVKNNLQILNSFLNLERRAYKDNPNIILDHMQSRLSSLAILHEKTYNTSDFKNINLKSYIKDQDDQLTSLIGMRDGIKFVSEVDDNLNLSIEIITPLLLVIDELTMNAIKHAFPDKSKENKIISKEIKIIDDYTAKLILKDNGIGIENSKETIKNSLGCEIIKNLTKQLNGTIKQNPIDNGTEFELTFPTTMEHTITQ